MSLFYASWNFYKEFIRLYRIHKIIKDIRNNPEQQNINVNKLENLHKIILEGGSIYIKCAQWFISHISYDKRYKHIVDYFYHLFEHCPSQTLHESDEIYYKATNRHMAEDINIDTIKEIGSGSIGTVYCAESITDGKKIALKIKHPYINNELEDKRLIISIIRKLQNINWFRKYFNLCFDLDDFINNIYLQTDFRIEAENMKKMQENYKSNKCIVIPHVLYSHNNILITEYIDTFLVEELGDYEKNLIAINLVCLVNQMCLVDNFIHGDLHCKNWKVRRCPINGNLQIVLFDMGICFSMADVQLAQNFWESLEDGNPEKIMNIIRKLCISQIPLEINKELDTLFHDMSINKIDSTVILTNLLNYFAEHNLKIYPYATNMLIMICLIENFLKNNGFIQHENKYRNIFSIIQASRIDILSYCECYNSYPEVLIIIKNKIHKYSHNTNNSHNTNVLILKSPEENINEEQ